MPHGIDEIRGGGRPCIELIIGEPMINAYGQWLMAYGLWPMAYGLRLMANGLWLMANGLWLMDVC